MANLQFYFDEYKKQITEIKNYITSVEMQKDVISELECLRQDEKKEIEKLVQYSKVIKDVVSSSIQYNAIIISIYGCFEQYIDNIFNEYCNGLYTIIDNYDEMPEKMKVKHIRKLGDFLLNPQRYKNYELTEKQAIKNAVDIFNNFKDGFDGNQKLILAHGGNLKIEQINELARDIGIQDFEQGIISNFTFKSYFIKREIFNEETYSRLKAKGAKRLFEKLDRLVEERNNVAHGWVENRINMSVILNEYIDYMECLSQSILDTLIKSLCITKYDKGMMYSLGKPLNVFDHHIICINNGDILLQKEDLLLAIKDNNRKVLKIKTIQIDGKDFDKINDKNVDVGIGFEKREDLNVDDEYEFYYHKDIIK